VFSADTGARIVLSVSSGELLTAQAARKERVSEQSISRRRADFVEAGRNRPRSGDRCDAHERVSCRIGEVSAATAVVSACAPGGPWRGADIRELATRTGFTSSSHTDSTAPWATYPHRDRAGLPPSDRHRTAARCRDKSPVTNRGRLRMAESRNCDYWTAGE
jgi:transposase